MLSLASLSAVALGVDRRAESGETSEGLGNVTPSLELLDYE
jgi:hypothetical protein